MSIRRKGPFYLVIVDHDKKIFNIEGPMTSDRAWNEQVLGAQQDGRDVRCFSIRPDSATELQQKIAEYKARNGFSESATSIVDTPLNTSHIFNGPLPEYAKKANRGRVVQVLCRDCGNTRWAEMDRDYPGRDVLSKTPVLGMSAKCLFCGAEAKDPYNWFRPGRNRDE